MLPFTITEIFHLFPQIPIQLERKRRRSLTLHALAALTMTLCTIAQVTLFGPKRDLPIERHPYRARCHRLNIPPYESEILLTQTLRLDLHELTRRIIIVPSAQLAPELSQLIRHIPPRQTRDRQRVHFPNPHA